MTLGKVVRLDSISFHCEVTRKVGSYETKQECKIFPKNPNFIHRIAQKAIETPEKSIIIGLSGEFASGKSTIRRILEKTAEQLGFSIETIETDNYFNDISALINEYGSFAGVIDSGYDVDSSSNFNLELLLIYFIYLNN